MVSVLIRAATLLWSLLAACQASAQLRRPTLFEHGLGLPSRRPLNLAHRGSSGVLPEHSRPAYIRAIADRADVIECDVCLTSDLQLVCRHDPWLSSTTNVADLSPFADRKRTIFIDGRNRTDWFTFDFTLSELLSLKARQGKTFRDQSHNDRYPLVSLDDFITIAKSADRPIGIYPELKHAEWTNRLEILGEKRFENLLLDSLHSHGYQGKRSGCVIQSFDESAIKYMATRTRLPLVMLTDDPKMVEQAKLQELAKICYGMGLFKGLIAKHHDKETDSYKHHISEITDVVARSHSLGMRVHVYTFRNEDQFLAWDYEQDPMKEYDLFMGVGIDGFFTDFAHTLTRYLDHAYRPFSLSRVAHDKQLLR